MFDLIWWTLVEYWLNYLPTENKSGIQRSFAKLVSFPKITLMFGEWVVFLDVDAVVTARREYHGTLTHLKVHPIKDDEARQPEAKRKVDVLRAILKDGKVIYTAEADEEGFTLRSEIRVVIRESNAFLRVDDEDIGEDFLPGLPNF
jgi:hypothetical protein